MPQPRRKINALGVTARTDEAAFGPVLIVLIGNASLLFALMYMTIATCRSRLCGYAQELSRQQSISGEDMVQGVRAIQRFLDSNGPGRW